MKKWSQVIGGHKMICTRCDNEFRCTWHCKNRGLDWLKKSTVDYKQRFIYNICYCPECDGATSTEWSKACARVIH